MAKDDENGEENDGIFKDPRFSHLVNDPRFRQLPKTARKVKIDKRFQPMFSDDKFRVKYTVDKYGRKVNKSSNDDLQKFYQLESSSDEEQEEEDIRKEEEAITNDDLEEDGGALSSNIMEKLRSSDVDYSRGEGRLLTDSSSDEESSEDDEEETYIEHVWGELDRDAPRTDESTSRLAACNMDWDRIRASDIMVLCNSFLPPGGSILSVKIYPSEFGKQRMAEEDLHGPPELTRKEQGSEEDSDEELVKEVDSDVEEGDEYHMEKLRQYQLNRLKYYYAVIEFDSVKTADKVYAECDGLEYESTATKFDLRFIPDDTTFDDEPKDVCTELPDLSKYQPRIFTTTALQQAKVELTWDETSVERKELGEKLLSGKTSEISDADLRKVVAYSSEEDSDEKAESSGDSSDSEEGDKNPINKYKMLLQEINKTESEKAQKKYEMEYTWGINTDKKPKDSELEKKKALTPIEKVLLKRSEKNKRRKEERRKKKLGDAAENEYSSDDMPSDIDLNDPYFAEEFAKGDFQEPVNKKKTKKSKSKDPENDEDEENKAKELQLLLDDPEEGEKQHFSLKKIQDAQNESKSKKRRKKLKKSRQEIEASKSKEEDNFEVNLSDNRFGAIYTSHLFNIDPTDPHFKKTKGMESIIHEKLKRRQDKGTAGQDHDREGDEDEESAAKRPKKNLENRMLIKNIKKKIMGSQNRS
ncbi:unnamed protein product [Hermetia illucens]|uniref:NUC153 domain-containing protein n=1 Tax=Hermetia illucens TaxID=343691 RepID=A0A7R8UTE0_HERIL|nr:ESF1 homolog [Hermetia illucens]CAD7086739.1 unnamed protein product [Hermetia illucens]